MNELHGTDAFTEDQRVSYDDTEPTLAALQGVAEDGYATDAQRAAARGGMSEIERLRKQQWAKDSEGREYLKPTVLIEVERELRQARTTHAPMNSHHEGYAVILEELDELWDVCKQNTHAFGDSRDKNELRKAKRAAMRKEAIQVAAMAIRFVEDVCDVESA